MPTRRNKTTRALRALWAAPDKRLYEADFCRASGVKRNAYRSFFSRLVDQRLIAVDGAVIEITFAGMKAIGEA